VLAWVVLLVFNDYFIAGVGYKFVSQWFENSKFCDLSPSDDHQANNSYSVSTGTSWS
jgi:hypothetical protein